MFPGMMFSLSKERMESTKLWKIIRRMPKGALLHGHLDAMVDFEHLFGIVFSTPGIHILADQPLTTPAALETASVTFHFRKQVHTEGNIWNDSYAASTPLLLSQAAEAFPDGGKEGFLRWLYSRCTISRTDAVAQHHGVDEIWKKFMRCFRIVNSMVHYEPIWRGFLRRLLPLLAADGVRWAELRFSSTNGCIIQSAGQVGGTFKGRPRGSERSRLSAGMVGPWVGTNAGAPGC